MEGFFLLNKKTTKHKVVQAGVTYVHAFKKLGKIILRKKP
jgi:hypothetical protein